MKKQKKKKIPKSGRIVSKREREEMVDRAVSISQPSPSDRPDKMELTRVRLVRDAVNHIALCSVTNRGPDAEVVEYVTIVHRRMVLSKEPVPIMEAAIAFLDGKQTVASTKFLGLYKASPTYIQSCIVHSRIGYIEAAHDMRSRLNL